MMDQTERQNGTAEYLEGKPTLPTTPTHQAPWEQTGQYCRYGLEYKQDKTPTEAAMLEG